MFIRQSHKKNTTAMISYIRQCYYKLVRYFTAISVNTLVAKFLKSLFRRSGRYLVTN